MPLLRRLLARRRPSCGSSVLPRALSPLVETLEGRTLLAFGVTATTGGNAAYVIDNGGDLQFSVRRPGSTTASTIHIGDVSSIRYKGQEMLASYAVTSRYSHYEQGLSAATTVTYTVNNADGWILVKADDSAAASGAVIQYYAVRRNDNNLYMASLPVDVNNGPGEGRFIAYLSRSVFQNPEQPSDLAGNTGAIEGGDVFGFADGTTVSKFYNMGRRMIENEYHGVTGMAGTTPVGAWMFMGNRERSAGGPFFKDIDFQAGSAVEIYNCIFTGHTQTEPFRQGLHTYALQFNNGSAPAPLDLSWLETMKDASGNLLISGLIPAAQRGAISGQATGNPAGHETVVTLTNAQAQYWDMADANGNYAITNVLPGTYTQTLYSNELAVGTRTVTITAGQTTRANLVNTSHTPAATWRIGSWDGTPLGFLNSDKIEVMHPSDSRMTGWTSTPNFVVGANTDAQWPMVQFMGVNNAQRITFNLTAAQASVAQTLRIGITLGFEGGRNRITVNGGQTYAWTSAIPGASRDLNSRGITRGTWRGDNQLYTYNIPTSALRAGTNTIDLPVVSGSYVEGQTWLSPNVVYDAIDLVPTASLTNAPRVSSIVLSPAGSTIGVNGTRTFTAVARDQFNNVIAANVDFSATRGVIDDTGLYTAPATTGADTITAVVGAITATTNITVVGATPVVTTPATASPNPVYGNTTTLSALGADDNGEANLTYTWSVVGTAPGPVTFAAANGTNAGKSTLATLSARGTYTFRVTVTDANGLSVTSDTSVTAYDKVVHYEANAASGATLVDSSGNNRTATLTGAYSFVPGVSGNAIRLTGGAATLPAGIVSGLDDFTIGAWVRPDAANNWARIFDFGTGTGAYMFLSARTGTAGNPLRFAITTSGGAGEQVVNGPTLALGVWTHVAVTLSGNTATLFVNGVSVGSNANVTTHPAALGNTTNNYLGDSQYAADPTFFGSIDDFRLYGRSLSSAEVSALAAVSDTLAPTVTGKTFAYESGQSVQLIFSEDVIGSVDLDDLSIVNVATGVRVPASEFSVTTQGAPGSPTTVTWTRTLANGTLADGNYRATLPAGRVTDAAGNPLAADVTLDFFVLAGDANRDRDVDFDDLLTLAQNYGQTGRTFSQGNFNYSPDGRVDFDDLLILAQRYGTHLVAAAPVVRSGGTAARRTGRPADGVLS